MKTAISLLAQDPFYDEIRYDDYIIALKITD